MPDTKRLRILVLPTCVRQFFRLSLPFVMTVLAFLPGGGCAERIRVERRFSVASFDWPMYGGSPARTNESYSAVRPPLKPVWEYNAMAGISAAPLVRDSVVLVGTLQGELHAIRLSDGESCGNTSVESAIAGTPVWEGQYAYVACALGTETLVSLSLRDGRRRWSARIGPVESSPLLIGEFLYVTTLDGALVALKKQDGTEFWKFEYAAAEDRKPVRSSPASDGAAIIFGSDDGWVLAVERLTGKLRWKLRLEGSIMTTPIISNGKCFIGTLEGALVAVDVESGALRWRYETESRIYAAPAASKNLVFIGSANGRLAALDARSGNRLWSFSARSVISSAPLVAGDVLYVGSLDRTLYALDSQTGEKLWEYEVEGRIRVSPVIWGDVLLLTHEDKYITALRPDRP